MSVSIFIKNLEYVNAAAYQHYEGVEEQHQSGNTEMGAQVEFVDDYLQKISELLDREAPRGSKDVPQVGTSAVLVIKQEQQNLVMPVHAVVQNQQEVSVVVESCLEVSVYGGMAVDKTQLQKHFLNRVLHLLLPLGQVQIPSGYRHPVKMYPLIGV